MHDYVYDVGTVRVAIILGAVVATLFYERMQLTTGGAIVPGYLALFLPRPLYIATCLVTSYLTFLVVNRLIAQRYILYGRRKFEIEVVTSLVFVAAWYVVASALEGWSTPLEGLYGIGFVLPAVIAHDVFRQGPRKTYLAILVNVGIIGLVVYVFSSLGRIAPWGGSGRATEFGLGRYGYP